MNIKKHTYIILSALAFTACSHDDNSAPTYTVGDADNAIVLSAGIAEGPSSVSSRAAEANHSKHTLFASGTKAFIRIDGEWHNESAVITPVSKTTTATIGGAAGTSGNDTKHNCISAYSPQLYWDDYGTADPANAGDGKGRKKGLTIYAAAIDGVTTAPTVSSWTDLSWTLDTDQKTNDWKNKDLLISYNIKDGKDGTLKFDDYIHDITKTTETKQSSDLLEFTHAMSKITVRLIAGEGFPTTGVGATATKFATAPEVKLTGNEGDVTTNAWANTACTINVTDGTYQSSGTPAVIKMHTDKTDDTGYTVIYDALVAPGSQFGAPTTVDEKVVFPIIARINADGNIYYVTSEKIRGAITKKYGSGNEKDFKTESGKNYIITVKVNKTKIQVTATITDWEDVEAEKVTPVINVSAKVGEIGSTGGTLSAFDFYMREQDATTYTAYGSATGTANGSTVWQFNNGSSDVSLYWPTHNTHYHMRGVSPTTTTVTDKKHIVVSNGAYNKDNFPGNLMIGVPEIAEANKMCNNSDHESVDMTVYGICARNNTVNLNFRYVMSQVEVKLKSTGTAGKDLVQINADAKVEIEGGYSKARILLETRNHDTYTNSDKPDNGIYTLNSRTLTDDETSANIIKYAVHDIIVPQNLTDDMKLKITVKNSDGTTDVYHAQLNKIKVKTNDDSGALITEWEPGKHYIYTLDIKKTEITVTATLTDWTTVEASEKVWF